MTLKIELIEGRIRLIGEFRSERLDQVKAEIDRRGSQSFWIWRSWIDVDGIRFLNAYEAKGISVSHCRGAGTKRCERERGERNGSNTARTFIRSS
jgi:hypothetical protein